jgi:hypothetical protein
VFGSFWSVAEVQLSLRLDGKCAQWKEQAQKQHGGGSVEYPGGVWR